MTKATNKVNMTLFPLWKTQFNNKEFPKVNQTFKLPSLTSPDQTMSIDQIRNRFAKGLPLTSAMKIPQYVGEGNDVEVDDDVLSGINWNTLDLTEKHEVIRNVQTNLKKLNDGIEYTRKKTHEEQTKKRQDFEARINTLFAEKKKTAE